MSDYRPADAEQLYKQQKADVRKRKKKKVRAAPPEWVITFLVLLALALVMLPVFDSLREDANAVKLEASARNVGTVINVTFALETYDELEFNAFQKKYSDWQSMAELQQGALEIERDIFVGLSGSANGFTNKREDIGKQTTVDVTPMIKLDFLQGQFKTLHMKSNGGKPIEVSHSFS